MKYLRKTWNVTTQGENHCALPCSLLYLGLGIGCMLILIITEHPAYPYSATDVARGGDGDASRVFLKYDAAKCSPGRSANTIHGAHQAPRCSCRLFEQRREENRSVKPAKTMWWPAAITQLHKFHSTHQCNYRRNRMKLACVKNMNTTCTV